MLRRACRIGYFPRRLTVQKQLMFCYLLLVRFHRADITALQAMKMPKFLLLLVILPCFVQSLSVNRISDALSFNNIFVDHREFGFTPAPPPHTEEAKLARYVVHYSGNLVICIL